MGRGSATIAWSTWSPDLLPCIALHSPSINLMTDSPSSMMAGFLYIIHLEDGKDKVEPSFQKDKKEKYLDIPYFKTFCCFSTRTGALLYGWAGVILYSSLIILLIPFYFTSPQIEDSYPLLKNKGIILPIVALKLASYALLLTGVYMRSAMILRVFIGAEVLYLVLQDAGYVVYTLMEEGNVYIFMSILYYTVGIIFFIVVVASFITQIKNETELVGCHAHINEVLKI